MQTDMFHMRNLDKCEYQVYRPKMNFDCLHHKPYMWLTSEDVISKLSSEELSQHVSKFEAVETNDFQCLMEHLKRLEHIRHLSLWHDHSVVLSRGYILVTLSIIFDEAVFDVCLRNLDKCEYQVYGRIYGRK